MSEAVEWISVVIVPLMMMYFFMIAFFYFQRYFRTYTRNRILKFTQEEVKEKRKEILHLTKNFHDSNPKNLTNIYEILSLYNELAVGINEGLYDELYIRMVLGHGMINFYKNFYNEIHTILYEFEKDDTLFMPLELLLKKWDSGDGPPYRLKNRRRYM